MSIDFLNDIEFDNEYIKNCLIKIDNNLKNYVREKIFPKYDLNDKGHNKDHIEFVLKRALELSKDYLIDYNLLYACVCFHDIDCHINRETQEKLSANIAYKDKLLNNFFNTHKMIIIKEAIEDYRASSNNIPRNIYGKILSSADRKVSIKNYFIASLFYKVDNINSLDMEFVIEKSYNYAIEKFGKNEYAINKFYVDDKKYKRFLTNLKYFIDNKDEFYKLAKIVFDEVKNK